MNERIRALALQAGYGARWTTTEQFEQFVDKLSELIVRECARIARDTDLEDVEGGDSAVLQAAGEQIQKHFGVK